MSVSQNTVGILTDRLGRTECTECGVELDVSDYTVFERIICPSCEQEQVVPAKLGEFLLLDLLGTGGMGAVYLAQDQKLRRQVALKVMRAQFGQDSKHYEDFRTEAQATARLNHPNIVQVYTLGDEKGQPYIVMELLGGDRLDELMENPKSLSNIKILEVARDVSRGLDAASKAGVIHGDIKPGNILFDQRNVAKVVDFGLAKFMEAGGADPANSEIWGTPFYIAPEKARKKGEDARSDQYSLGATLWHCLAGEAPFDGETPADVVLARFKKPPPSICEVREDISEKTDHILMRMMARKPEHRYPTYSSLLADIEEALEEAKALEHTPVYEESKSPPWVKHALTYGGGILLVGILAAVFAPKEDPEIKTPDKGDYVTIIDADGNKKRVPRSESDIAALGKSAPFTVVEEDRIVQGAKSFMEGRAFNADSQFTKAENAYKSHMLQYHWLELFRAINTLMEGDSVATGALIRPLIIQSKPYSKHPALREDPRDMAKMLVGQMKPEEFFEAHANSQGWYKDFGHFVTSLVNARRGQFDLAVEHANTFANAESTEPKWVYAFRPYAGKVAQQAAALKVVLKKNPNASLLSQWSKSNLGLWDKALEKHAPKTPAGQVVKKPTVKPKAVRKPVVVQKPAAPAKPQVNGAERQKIESHFAALLPEMVSDQYNNFLDRKLKSLPSVSSAPGRQMLADYTAAYKSVTEVRNFLTANVKRKPYGGSNLESGLPLSAKYTAILFEKNGKKKAIKYSEVPPLDLLRIISWYLNNSDGVQDLDQKLLGLSLYAKHYKAPQYAEQVWNSIGPTYKKTHPYSYLMFE